MAAIRLHASEFIKLPDVAHHARRRFTETRPLPAHTHNFIEVFWVDTGTGVHLINGQRRELRTGDLVFVRAEDRHSFAADDARGGLEITNVAFGPMHWRRLSVRYFADGKTAWDLRPIARREHSLPARALARLQMAAEELAAGRRGPLALDRFLLNLLALTETPTGLSADAEVEANPAADGPIPDWLRRACELTDRAALLAEGVPALVHQAARSPAHVSREFRRHLGCTPTEWVNRLRMAHAAERLGGSEAKILDVIADCGIQNPRHFYALFRRRHGLTPRQYRLREQRVFQPKSALVAAGLRPTRR